MIHTIELVHRPSGDLGRAIRRCPPRFALRVDGDLLLDRGGRVRTFSEKNARIAARGALSIASLFAGIRAASR